MTLRWLETVARLVALMVALLMGAEEADARVVGGMDLGSPAALIRTSVTAAEGGLTRRAAWAQLSPAGGSLSDFFRRGGLLGGFAAGFLGSGLLGLLFGRGLLGGLSGVPSYLGLLFQLALVVMLGRLIWTRWHHIDFAGVSGVSPRHLADPYLRSREDVHAGLDSAAGVADQKTASPGGRAGKIKPPRNSGE